jgi:uncharacterized membrane protein
MAVAADVSMDRQGSLLLPFALSLFMHALLLLLFVAGVLQAPKREEQPFQVEIVQPQAEPPPSAQAKAPPSPAAEKPAVAPPAEQAVPPPKNQIVNPPDSPEQTPEKAHLFSDRDSKALEEIYSSLTTHWQLLLGLTIIALVIFLPGGLASLAGRFKRQLIGGIDDD